MEETPRNSDPGTLDPALWQHSCCTDQKNNEIPFSFTAGRRNDEL